MLRDLLLVDQDVGVFEHALHRVRIGDEVRREVAAVELHAFDPFDFGLQALAFVDGDHAVLADLFHRVGEQIRRFRGRCWRRSRPTLAISSLFLILIDIFFSFSVMSATAFSMPCFICTGLTPATTALQAFVEDRFGQHGGGGGAVAGDVARLAGDFADHAGAHVLVDVFQLDFLGDGDAVLGDGRRAEALLQNHVAALGAERHLDGAGQLGNAAANRVAGFLIECNHLGHEYESPSFCDSTRRFAAAEPIGHRARLPAGSYLPAQSSRTARMSSSRISSSSSSSTLNVSPA